MIRALLLCLIPGLGWLFLSAFKADEPAPPCPVDRVVEPPTPAGEGAEPVYPPALPALPVAPVEAPDTRDWKVPRWIIAGILAVETKSKLRVDDTVRYVDKTRGALGERGPTQLRRCAFDQVKRPGEAYWRVETDMAFALDITERYLLWLHKHTGSWAASIRAYNAGLGGRSCSAAHAYYQAVRSAITQ